MARPEPSPGYWDPIHRDWSHEPSLHKRVQIVRYTDEQIRTQTVTDEQTAGPQFVPEKAVILLVEEMGKLNNKRWLGPKVRKLMDCMLENEGTLAVAGYAMEDFQPNEAAASSSGSSSAPLKPASMGSQEWRLLSGAEKNMGKSAWKHFTEGKTCIVVVCFKHAWMATALLSWLKPAEGDQMVPALSPDLMHFAVPHHLQSVFDEVFRDHTVYAVRPWGPPTLHDEAGEMILSPPLLRQAKGKDAGSGVYAMTVERAVGLPLPTSYFGTGDNANHSAFYSYLHLAYRAECLRTDINSGVKHLICLNTTWSRGAGGAKAQATYDRDYVPQLSAKIVVHQTMLAQRHFHEPQVAACRWVFHPFPHVEPLEDPVLTIEGDSPAAARVQPLMQGIAILRDLYNQAQELLGRQPATPLARQWLAQDEMTTAGQLERAVAAADAALRHNTAQGPIATKREALERALLRSVWVILDQGQETYHRIRTERGFQQNIARFNSPMILPPVPSWLRDDEADDIPSIAPGHIIAAVAADLIHPPPTAQEPPRPLAQPVAPAIPAPDRPASPAPVSPQAASPQPGSPSLHARQDTGAGSGPGHSVVKSKQARKRARKAERAREAKAQALPPLEQGGQGASSARDDAKATQPMATTRGSRAERDDHPALKTLPTAEPTYTPASAPALARPSQSAANRLHLGVIGDAANPIAAPSEPSAITTLLASIAQSCPELVRNGQERPAASLAPGPAEAADPGVAAEADPSVADEMETTSSADSSDEFWRELFGDSEDEDDTAPSHQEQPHLDRATASPQDAKIKAQRLHSHSSSWAEQNPKKRTKAPADASSSSVATSDANGTTNDFSMHD